MDKKTLKQFYAEHVGKVSDKWSSYFNEYDQSFDAYRNKPVNLLEIGVQNGGSLEIWLKYFTKAQKLVGCDCNVACSQLKYEDPRVNLVIGDANSDEVEAKILAHSKSFDIIIDDGSHRSSDVIKSFIRYFPYLKDDGLFVIEDLHCSYWQEFEGALFDPFSSIQYFKRLIDIINYEHWGIDKTRVELLDGFSKKYGCSFDESIFSSVHSIKFVNSMCILRKASPDSNQLGPEYLAGTVEAIEKRLECHLKEIVPISQRNNILTTCKASVEEELMQHIETLVNRDKQIASFSQTMAEYDGQIASLKQVVMTYQKSRSWRLTAPARILGHQIKRAKQYLLLRFKQIWTKINRCSRFSNLICNFLRGETKASGELPQHSFHFHVDNPKAGLVKIIDGSYSVSGWAVNLNAHSAVKTRIVIGKKVYHPDLKQREDVQRAFESVCELPLSTGFSISLMLPRGIRRMRIEIKAVDGSWVTVRRALLIRNRVINFVLYLGILIKKIHEIYKQGLLFRKIKAVLRSLSRFEFTIIKSKLLLLSRDSLLSNEHDSYKIWCEKNKFRAKEMTLDRKNAVVSKSPLISVLVPVYDVPDKYLRQMVDSVINQSYKNWELLLVDDCSISSHIQKTLLEYADKDSRIRVKHLSVNSNISVASNAGIEMARGDYVALLDHDDLLAEHALESVASEIIANPALDMIYSDEDKVTANGVRFDPFFKPDWSPEYLLGCMYTCHLGVYRTSLLHEIGGFRSEFDLAQDYDLVLRIAAKTSRIHHIPDVLYHWRTLPTSTASGSEAKPTAHKVAARALQAHLDEVGRKGKVVPGPSIGFHRVKYDILGNPKVSIVIPTACKKALIRSKKTCLLSMCIQSILGKSSWKNYEIIVVDNNDMPASLADKMKQLGVKCVSYTGEFNLSAKINLGAEHATGEHLILLNDDIEVISSGWMEAMLEFSQQPEIGVVGAKLLFPDNRLQHVGVTIQDGNPGHPWYQHHKNHPGYYFGNMVHRNYSAVTGACLMTKTSLYKENGGFRELLPLNYNDVDYCLRIVSSGLRIVYTPYAELFHYESVSKSGNHLDELPRFKELWAEKWLQDPYFNPNLDPGSCEYKISI